MIVEKSVHICLRKSKFIKKFLLAVELLLSTSMYIEPEQNNNLSYHRCNEHKLSRLRECDMENNFSSDAISINQPSLNRQC